MSLNILTALHGFMLNVEHILNPSTISAEFASAFHAMKAELEKVIGKSPAPVKVSAPVVAPVAVSAPPIIASVAPTKVSV